MSTRSFASFLVLLLAACGTGTDYFPGVASDVDVSDSANSDADDTGATDDATATPCERHADCRGGEVCREGTCQAVDSEVCEPSARSCDGNVAVVCNALGTAVTREECGTDTCRNGLCIPEDCVPGTSLCAGDVRLSCNVDGDLVETDCNASNAYCQAVDEDTAACVAWECLPGTVTCDGSGTQRVVCDARGASFELVTCDGETACSGGECRARVCSAGTRTCTDGDVYVCSAGGAGWSLAERCADGATCDAGACVGDVPECATAGDCPPPRGRCEGTVLVTTTGNGVCSRGVCDYAPVTQRRDCASSGRVCSSVTLTCELPTGEDCTSDDDCSGGRCVSGTCAECATDVDCPPEEVCVDGRCTGCSCAPGFVCDVAGDCVEGDPTSCSSDAECQDLAEALGASPDGVACDSEVGCFVRGACDGGMLPSGTSDPFDAPCPDGLVCDFVLDLSGGTVVNSCKGCVVGDDSTCRDGEVCYEPVLGFPDNTPYCTADGGGGFPFPFP